MLNFIDTLPAWMMIGFLVVVLAVLTLAGLYAVPTAREEDKTYWGPGR